MTIGQGTFVDATLIAALSSIKNNEGKLGPEVQQTKKDCMEMRRRSTPILVTRASPSGRR